MHLKSLEIQGFKSFADRTVIHFDEGITGIVGPNGSGKSNVTDAIRWVLGEQSARVLRGAKMEDVIFSGTKTRRALSYAEVSLCLDNSDQTLPIDYSEVLITRRLYRSGESQYAINQQACRLKDIHRLFMDTGLGKDGYSIISQGRVDEILSTKSEDRRRVFEEASGIQKFRSRRDEALKRLEQTENNLQRVSDILLELEGQMKPLEKQAEQAKIYLRDYAELKEKDVALSAWKIEQKQAILKSSSDKLALAEGQLNELVAEGLTLEAQNRDWRAQQAELERSLSEHQAKHSGLRDQLKVLEEAQHTLEQERIALTSRQEHREQNRQAALLRHEQLQAELSELDHLPKPADCLEAEAALEAQQQELASLDQRLEVAQVSFKEQQSQKQNLQTHALQLAQDLAKLESSDQVYLSEAKQREFELTHLAEQVQASEAELEKAQVQLTQAQSSYDQQAESCAHLNQQLQAQEVALREARATYNQVVQTLDQTDYRLQTLEQQLRSHEGYHDSVRRLLEAVEHNPRFQSLVYGTVAENLTVSSRYELAIEIALGAAQQNIIVEDQRIASDLLDLLKRERLGRVTLLPLQQLKASPLPSEQLQQLRQFEGRGYLGQAHDLVDYLPRDAKAFEQLLQRVAICEDLDSALAISRALKQSVRLVTLDGDVISPGGAMTGGRFQKKSASLVARKREYQELERQLHSLELDSEKAEARVDQQVAKEACLRKEAQVAREELALLEATLSRATTALKEQEFKLERQKRAQATELERQIQLQRHLGEAKTRQEALQLALAEVESQLQNGLETEQAQEALLRTIWEEKEALRQQRIEHEQVLHRFQQQQEARQVLVERIQRDLAEQEQCLMELASLTERDQIDLETLKQKQKELDERRQAEEIKLGQDGLVLLELEQSLKLIQQRLAQLFDQLKAQAEQLSLLEQEKSRLTLMVQKAESELDALRDYLWETYHLTSQNAGHCPLDAVQERQYQTRVQELKQSIRQLGHVNVNAVEDFRALEERHQFLKQQEQDVLDGKQQLTRLIQSITSEMSTLFKQNLEQINLNFQEVFAALFGGGQAHIRLSDPSDLLNSDIEIKASPPGKKLQNMLLLSGGERSLSAIALLFAILKLRATPFCVLDEIEAALDESNVFRFTNYIHHYAKRSQFILVTHRKGTMEASDRLYGVTMQERGVSQVLSMRLS